MAAPSLLVADQIQLRLKVAAASFQSAEPAESLMAPNCLPDKSCLFDFGAFVGFVLLHFTIVVECLFGVVEWSVRMFRESVSYPIQLPLLIQTILKTLISVHLNGVSLIEL